ncbi:MAG: hypothetical protein EA377_13370 [Phycisphaerales bacterium]|nr:MAG: hypothetical protein EA377_13370 [Phycisphaerales bacterium]
MKHPSQEPKLSEPKRPASRWHGLFGLIAVAGILPAVADPAEAGDASPYATQVVSYDPGSPAPPLNDPTLALGEPTRDTGFGGFTQVVSPFYPAFTNIVSIGPGGHLTLAFDTPIVNDPNHPFGIDLIVFGNSFFTDTASPNGVVGGLFKDGGLIEVSQDGEDWFTVPDIEADGLYPTLGYTDAGPYDTASGRVETDFSRPVNPALTLDDFLGLTHEDLVEIYDGSGGGAGIDLSTVGVNEILYVRISHAEGAFGTVEVDAVSRTFPQVFADLNGDGVVNVFDLLILLENWGVPSQGGSSADLNNDGVVNVFDLLLLLENWG